MPLQVSRRPNGAFDTPRPRLRHPSEERAEAERAKQAVAKRFPVVPLAGVVREVKR